MPYRSARMRRNRKSSTCSFTSGVSKSFSALALSTVTLLANPAATLFFSSSLMISRHFFCPP